MIIIYVFFFQAVVESSRSALLLQDSHDLKNRILDREKTLFALMKIVRNKIGEKATYDIITELEENGISAAYLLAQANH